LVAVVALGAGHLVEVVEVLVVAVVGNQHKQALLE
jgi:hypothetical protein